MSDALDKLDIIKANNEADAAAIAELESDLNATPETTGDKVLAAMIPVVTADGLIAVFGEDALVKELEAAGFTVTPPAPAAPADVPAA